MDIEWLFFDIGSTLADESETYKDLYREIAIISNRSEKYISDEVLKLYKENKRGDIEICNILGIKKPIWDPTHERLYADTQKCLKVLSQKYKIGIIANQIPGVQQRLKKFGISKYFDVIVTSADVGVSKPDQRIFEIALNRAKCHPSQAIMIGDSIEYDIVPSKKIGIKTIWIKQGMGKYWKFSSENERPDFEVDCLSELLGIL